MAGSWTCGCGRRVPSGVSTCRCGRKRDAGGPLETAPPPLLPTPPAQGGGEERSYAWVGKLLSVLAVVAIYFGSRGCNRWSASREARSAALEALTPVLGADEARTLVDEHHAACFEQHYKTGWGRRSRSTFDGEKYAQCILKRADSELTELKRQAAKESRRRPPPRPRATPLPVPDAPVPAADGEWAAPEGGSEAPEGDWAAPEGGAEPSEGGPDPAGEGGQVGLGDAKVLQFAREPQLMLKVSFVAIGRPEVLRQVGRCTFTLECGGQLPGPAANTQASCPLAIEGAKGTGELEMVLAGEAPPGDCSLEIALTDGTRLRSNTTVIQLP